jgi:hypothetical protein
MRDGGLPIVWLALTVFLLVPVWHQRLLPMLDTANHLALVRGWHSYDDPSYRISEYYTLRIRPVPYFLFYLSIHLLMYLFSIEVANKLFLSAYLILYPISILAITRALKRSPWLALCAFPLAFNQNWIYGFSSYLMGTVFLFFALAALLRFLDEGERSQAVWLSVSSVLAYFSHVLPWFCFGLCAILILLLEWRKWRRGVIASVAMLPSVLLAAWAYFDEKHERTYMKAGETFSGTWRDFPTAVMEFPKRVMELFPGSLDAIVLGVLAATLIGLVVWKRVRDGARPITEPLPESDRRLRWLLALLMVVYVSLPYAIAHPMSWWYVSPRLPSLMAPLLMLWPDVKLIGRQRLAMLPIIAGAIALPLYLAHLYRDFSNRNASFMRLVAELPRGVNTMVVVRGMMRGNGSEEKSGDFASSGPVYWHFSSWPMALNGGFGAYVFDQGIPIRPKKILRAPLWSTTDTFDIRQAPEFDYYIVRMPLDSMDREPSLKIVDQVGEWTLYKRIGELTDEP